MPAPVARAGEHTEQRPDHGDDCELTDLDARIESKERRDETVGRKIHLGENAGEAEAMDEPERERDSGADPSGSRDDIEQSEVTPREERQPEQRGSRDRAMTGKRRCGKRHQPRHHDPWNCARPTAE